MNNIDADVLVTGATGFIGRWLLCALTARGRNVAALVRNAPERGAELRAFVDARGGDARRLVVISGDVAEPSLGLERDLPGVRDVYHLAARFEFGMKPEEAKRTNVEGTLNALAWAKGRPNLRRFVFVGGYRMTRPGPALVGARFPLEDAQSARLYREHGAYEASKHESYLAFRSFVEAHGLKATAVHPSTVIGDSRTGETLQVTGLGETVARLWEGRLPALVGTAKTFVPVVTVDYLASFLATVAERDETIGQELTVLDPSTPELPALVKTIAVHLGVSAPCHVLPVSVVRALPQALTGVPREALSFLVEDRYDTASADAHARAVGLTQPDLAKSLTRWCDYLVSTRFGADREADRGALRGGAFSVGDAATADVAYLHGLPWNGDAWKPVASRVEKGHARLDLPGLGRSAETTEGYAEWLERALSGRTAPVWIVAHSLGAGVAVQYAHAHPRKVRGLVLVSPAFLQAPASTLLRATPLVSRALRRSSAPDLADRLLPERDREDAVPPAVVSASVDLRRGKSATRAARALAHASRASVRADLASKLAELTCPIVLVHGDADPLLAHPPRADVHVIARAGHAPHVTRPALVAAIVRRAVGE